MVWVYLYDAHRMPVVRVRESRANIHVLLLATYRNIVTAVLNSNNNKINNYRKLGHDGCASFRRSML